MRAASRAVSTRRTSTAVRSRFRPSFGISVTTPSPQPFLAAEARDPSPDAAAIVLGLATDGGVSFRPGAVVAPGEIRAFSESIETFSPRAGRDLDDVVVIDAGDVTSRENVGPAVAAVLDAAP